MVVDFGSGGLDLWSGDAVGVFVLVDFAGLVSLMMITCVCVNSVGIAILFIFAQLYAKLLLRCSCVAVACCFGLVFVIVVSGCRLFSVCLRGLFWGRFETWFLLAGFGLPVVGGLVSQWLVVACVGLF